MRSQTVKLARVRASSLYARRVYWYTYAPSSDGRARRAYKRAGARILPTYIKKEN